MDKEQMPNAKIIYPWTDMEKPQYTDEADKLRSDIFSMLIHLPRIDMLRFARKQVYDLMEEAGLNPLEILKDDK